MTIFACFVIVAITAGSQTLTDKPKDNMSTISMECQKQTGVSQDSIEKVRNGEFVDDPKLKAQVLCVSKKIGLANQSGDLDIDVLKSSLEAVATNDEEVDKMVEKCVVKRATPEQSAYDTFKCLHKAKPKFSLV